MRSWIFLIFATLIMSTFVNASDAYYTDCELSVQQIVENKVSCVKEVVGNKIYLKPDYISVSENGIYALLNEAGEYACISELYADAAGCFIQFNSLSRNRDQADYYKSTCRGCGLSYVVYCKNPDCPLKKKNK